MSERSQFPNMIIKHLTSEFPLATFRLVTEVTPPRSVWPSIDQSYGDGDAGVGVDEGLPGSERQAVRTHVRE